MIFSKFLPQTKKIKFTLSTKAKKVELVGNFTNWQFGSILMEFKDGKWQKEITLPEGFYLYKFIIDGKTWIHDTRAELNRPDGFGGLNSVVIVKSYKDILDKILLFLIAAGFIWLIYPLIYLFLNFLIGGSISVKFKLSGIFVSVILLLTGISLYFGFGFYKKLYIENLKTITHGVVSALAIEKKDKNIIQEKINQWIDLQRKVYGSDIIYISIHDETGKILAQARRN